MPLPAVILCLALACVLPAFSFAGDQYHAELARVAILPGGFAGYFPCGVNHKGCGDVFGTCGGIRDSLLVCEDSGGNAFRLIRPGFVTGPILDLAYRDGDSLAEMLTQHWMDSLKLYRAFSRDSFPTHQVWSVYTPYQIDYALFCRLDPGGPQDIVACGRAGGLYVYEDQGGDSWAEVPFPHCSSGDIMGTFAIGDFSSDGHTQLAGGNERGDLIAYEAMGGHQYVCVCSLGHAPGLDCDYKHAAADDMDQNGHPELISIFDRWTSPFESCLVRIYEEPQHGDFVCVDSLNHNPIYRLNRYLHHLRGKRTRTVVKRCPDMDTIDILFKQFPISAEVRFFGIFSFLVPVLRPLLGSKRTARLLNVWDDRCAVLHRYAFKFVFAGQKAQ